MGRNDAIQTTIDNRGIGYLLHFTQACNVPGIIAHGILSRQDLISRHITAYGSDAVRLDEENQAVSASIGSFNVRMFEAKRQRQPNASWVFPLLNPDILWALECRFYRTNPARGYLRNSRRKFGATTAFLDIFSDYTFPLGRNMGNSYRKEHSIPLHFPTMPDAEVQVMEPIPTRFILGAVIEDSRLHNEIEATLVTLSGPKRPVFIAEFDQWFIVGSSVWGFFA